MMCNQSLEPFIACVSHYSRIHCICPLSNEGSQKSECFYFCNLVAHTHLQSSNKLTYKCICSLMYLFCYLACYLFSFNGSPCLDDSPFFVHRRLLLPRSMQIFGRQLNDSGSFTSSLTPSPKVPVDDESLPSFNLTSRNLIDLFNAAESDED